MDAIAQLDSEYVWVPDEEEAWIAGKVKNRTAKHIEVIYPSIF